MDAEAKAKLLAERLPQEDVPIEGVGIVRVRGLNRKEVLMLQAHGGETRERKMIALAMLDPVLTEAEVGDWSTCATSGEIETVTIKIAKLSGLTVTVDKEAYKEFEDDPAAEFRVLPGEQAADDGSGNARADEQR